MAAGAKRGLWKDFIPITVIKSGAHQVSQRADLPARSAK